MVYIGVLIDPGQPLHYNSRVSRQRQFEWFIWIGKLGTAGRARMPGEDQGASLEKIRSELTSRAREMWGEQRAAEDSAAIEDTARQLWEVSQNLPHREMEPGFFQ